MPVSVAMGSPNVYNSGDKHAGVLFHNDRGSQYASGAFRDALK